MPPTAGDYFNLAIDQEEANTVRQMFHWYVEDGYGAAKIANMLNEQGSRAKRNCQWSQKMVSYNLTKGEQLESILNSTFQAVEDIAGVLQMTHAQLKRIIQKIEVDKDGNVDVYLRLLGDLGLDEAVLIRHDHTYWHHKKEVNADV